MDLSPIKPEKLPIGTLVPNARYRGKWEIKIWIDARTATSA
jgi:hypothetical protein